MKTGLRILIASSECSRIKSRGGMAVVAYDMSHALASRGHDVTLVLPNHNMTFTQMVTMATFPGPGHPRAELHLKGILDNRNESQRVEVSYHGRREAANVTRFVAKGNGDSKLKYMFVDDLKGGRFLHRETEVYGEKDDAERYLFFSAVVSQIVAAAYHRADSLLKPFDVVISNDWPTALVHYYLRHVGDIPRPFWPAQLHMVHNLGSMCGFAHDLFYDITREKNPWVYDPFAGMTLGRPGTEDKWVDQSKAAIMLADRTVFVSNGYLRNVLAGKTPKPADLYTGFLSYFHANNPGRLVGITNGIADDLGPDKFAAAGAIPRAYSAQDLSGKKECKAKLQHDTGLTVNDKAFLLVGAGRWTEQKGTDATLGALPALLEKNPDMQYLAVGSDDTGDRFLQKFQELAARYPGRVAVKNFTLNLESLALAGGDALLMPSRWEPCGLTQMAAQKMGTLVVCTDLDGLAETVTEGKTGFKFPEVSAEGISQAVDRAHTKFTSDPDGYKAMQAEAMRQDFSWTTVAARYEDLMADVVAQRRVEIDAFKASHK